MDWDWVWRWRGIWSSCMVERSARKVKDSGKGIGLQSICRWRRSDEIRRERKSVVVKLSGGAVADGVVRLDGVHVLLVEDDDDSRKLLGTMLKRYGARVTSTKSAAEALERV